MVCYINTTLTGSIGVRMSTVDNDETPLWMYDTEHPIRSVQGYFLPPIMGGKQDFGNYFPPLSETLGGNFFISPPIIWGNFGVSPPFWGVFAHFSGFWGKSKLFPPIIWDPGGEVKNRFPPIMGGK